MNTQHLFANNQKVSIIDEYTETIIGDEDKIFCAVEDMPLVKDMHPSNIRMHIQNANRNDTKYYEDSQVMSFHTIGGNDFLITIKTRIEQILGIIFDNTDDLDLFIKRCTLNYILYQGNRTHDLRNGKIFVKLSILEDVSTNRGHKCFHTIRDYEIEITFEETRIVANS